MKKKAKHKITKHILAYDKDGNPISQKKITKKSSKKRKRYEPDGRGYYTPEIAEDKLAALPHYLCFRLYHEYVKIGRERCNPRIWADNIYVSKRLGCHSGTIEKPKNLLVKAKIISIVKRLIK